MEKSYEERILVEILEEFNEQERVIINRYKDIFIKAYNISRLNNINKMLK